MFSRRICAFLQGYTFQILAIYAHFSYRSKGRNVRKRALISFHRQIEFGPLNSLFSPGSFLPQCIETAARPSFYTAAISTTKVLSLSTSKANLRKTCCCNICVQFCYCSVRSPGEYIFLSHMDLFFIVEVPVAVVSSISSYKAILQSSGTIREM